MHKTVSQVHVPLNERSDELHPEQYISLCLTAKLHAQRHSNIICTAYEMRTLILQLPLRRVVRRE